jgi:hypothetical protein
MSTDTVETGRAEVPQGYLEMPDNTIFTIGNKTFIKINESGFAPVHFDRTGRPVTDAGVIDAEELTGAVFDEYSMEETNFIQERNTHRGLQKEFRTMLAGWIEKTLPSLSLPHA